MWKGSDRVNELEFAFYRPMGNEGFVAAERSGFIMPDSLFVISESPIFPLYWMSIKPCPDRTRTANSSAI